MSSQLAGGEPVSFPMLELQITVREDGGKIGLVSEGWCCGGPLGEGGCIDDGARCLRASSVARQGSVLGADSPLIGSQAKNSSLT